ncbi:DUF7336 domain-containing protein [Asanoa iriomotensis]|uniref:DUF7336 domain-containing protein n=1 Tax=Asanoa iriomotensis TaxID=234613 RepID=UPI0019433549|nr:hypothetical protein [Asanoa iriomotensis]
MDVWLLHHVRHARNDDGTVDHVDELGDLTWDEWDGDDLKLLGVYATEAAARARIERARTLPGFDAEPDCFTVSSWTVDEDHWTEGFSTAE